MTKHLPGEIRNVLQLLERASGLDPSEDQVRSFKNAVYLLNDAMEDVPTYREQGRRIKLAQTLALLARLSTREAPLEFHLWLDYLTLFCIDLRREIHAVKTENSSLFAFFLTFIQQYLSDIAPELKTNIESFLEEI